MTSTIARTDRHRPSAPEFDPQDYTCHGVFDLHPDSGSSLRRRKIVSALVEQGYRFASGSGKCGHCGQHIRYAALMVHISQEMIYVGETCLDNRFSGMTKAEFKQLQAEAKLARELALTKVAFEIACDDNQQLAYATYAENIRTAAPEGALKDWHLDTLADIARKARQYGSATPGQLNLVERLVGELEDQLVAFTERQVIRAAEQAARIDAFIGTVNEKKRQFTGVVRLTYKHEDNGFGASKMLIIDTPEGTVKWTSGTDQAFALHQGDEVTFIATIKAHEIYQDDKQTVVLRPKFA